MKSKWASLFGFPNTIIGLTAYPMAVFTGLIMIMNQVNSEKFLRACNILAGVGIVMNLVLLYISDYLIGALYPWCLLAGNLFVLLLRHMFIYKITM